MTCNLDGFGFSKSLNAENMYCRIGSTVSTYKSQKSLLMFHKKSHALLLSNQQYIRQVKTDFLNYKQLKSKILGR